MNEFPLVSHGNAVLGYSAFIAGNQGVCRIHYGLGRAVVVHQAEDARAREILLEIQDILDLGAAEAIYGLGVVTYHADVLMARCQFPKNKVLGHVGILILIHKDVIETGGNVLKSIRDIP